MATPPALSSKAVESVLTSLDSAVFSVRTLGTVVIRELRAKEASQKAAEVATKAATQQTPPEDPNLAT